MAGADFRPPEFSITAYSGDGLTLSIEVVDEQDEAVDLAGVTVAASVRSTPSSSELLEEFYAEVTDASEGRFIISLQGEQTHDLVRRSRASDCVFRGCWDLQADFPNGPATLVRGDFICAPDVTRVPVA